MERLVLILNDSGQYKGYCPFKTTQFKKNLAKNHFHHANPDAFNKFILIKSLKMSRMLEIKLIIETNHSQTILEYISWNNWALVPKRAMVKYIKQWKYISRM